MVVIKCSASVNANLPLIISLLRSVTKTIMPCVPLCTIRKLVILLMFTTHLFTVPLLRYGLILLLGIATVQTSWGNTPNFPMPRNTPTTANKTAVLQPNTTPTLPALKTPALSIPAGTTFTVSILQPISSQINKVGDTIEAKLETPLTAENKLVVPQGSLVKGKIIGIRSSGGAMRSGSISLLFTGIIPTGTTTTIPLQAKIKTPNGSGVLEGEGFKSNAGQIATKTAIGAATGAAAGSIGGLIRHSSVQNGAIVGASLGAAVGLIHSLWQTKPQPVELETNAPLTLVLEQLLTINTTLYKPTQVVLPPYTPKNTSTTPKATPSDEPNSTGYYGY